MHWCAHSDPADFLAATCALAERAAVNQMPLGLVAGMMLDPTRFEEVRMFTVEDGGGRCLGACATPT